MTEKLLQFIWRFQYFNKNELATSTDECIQVIHPGFINHKQGPDLLNAKIIIGETTWAGTVELHVKKSDWEKHNHGGDRNYNNVILHVVWQDDEISNADLNVQYIPVLELQNLVPKILLQRYEELMNASFFIPCAKTNHSVSDITWRSWKERLLAERLLRKAEMVEVLYKQSNNHWEETFWWCLPGILA